MREWKDKHPNVAAVHGVVKDPVNHTPKYIIYDFATSSLERCLRDSSKSVTVTRWKRVWQQLFLGLAHLHGKSPPVIHGNIEPNTVVARTYQDGSTLLWLNAGLGSWRQALSLNSPSASTVSRKDARDGVLSFFRPPECSGQRGQVLDTLQAGLQADVYTAALLAAYLFLEFVVLPSTKSEKEHSLFENFKLNSDSTGATTTRPVSLGVRTVTETVDSVLAWLRSHKGCEQLADVLQLCLDKHPHNRPSAQDVCKALELFDESCLLAADGGPSKEEIMVRSLLLPYE
jgi:serine/threonine protein kinase